MYCRGRVEGTLREGKEGEDNGGQLYGDTRPDFDTGLHRDERRYLNCRGRVEETKRQGKEGEINETKYTVVLSLDIVSFDIALHRDVWGGWKGR